MRAGPLKAVIFDLDGVVLNSMPSHVAAWQAAFAEVGAYREADFFFRNEGSLDWEKLRDTFDGQPFGPEIFENLLTRQREIYLSRYASGVGVYPKIPGILDQLAQAGLRLALVTSSARQVLQKELADWLSGYFNPLITGDLVSKSKPHPEPYLKALEDLGIAPHEAVVVENAPAGIESARRAGLPCVALSTTLPPPILSKADFVLRDHAALSDWLSKRL